MRPGLGVTLLPRRNKNPLHAGDGDRLLLHDLDSVLLERPVRQAHDLDLDRIVAHVDDHIGAGLRILVSLGVGHPLESLGLKKLDARLGTGDILFGGLRLLPLTARTMPTSIAATRSRGGPTRQVADERDGHGLAPE